MDKCSNDLFQAVRILDVVLIGPAMIQAGRKIGGNIGTLLSVIGIATIVFNGLTFFDIESTK